MGTSRIAAVALAVALVAVPGGAFGQGDPPPKKEAETVKSRSVKALVTAVVGAAQDDKFQVESFSSEGGVVRLFEEHRVFELVEKGESFSYCSQSVGLGSCTQVTTEFKPHVVDDRGMLRTWRRVLFQPAPDAGRFHVLFEKFDPQGSGFAVAEKEERESFHRRLNDRLRAMQATRGGRFDPAELREQRDTAKSGPASLYELVTIGGQSVPTQAVMLGMVSESVYLLARDGAFRSSTQTNVGIEDASGKYTVNGAVVMFQSNQGLAVGRLEGDSLTITVGRLQWVYRRSQP